MGALPLRYSRARPLLRSYLFAPGSSARILGKVLDAGADAVVLDLEDAVAPADKVEARERVAAHVAERAAEAACAVHVRVNATDDGYDQADITAVLAPGLDGLRLPKAAEAAAVAAVAALLDDAEAERGLAPGSVRLYPTVESAAGVLAARELAACPRVESLVFGAADFLADIGASGAQRDATLLARSHLVLASRAVGIAPPVDGAHTDLDDEEGLRSAARWARGLGFFGKSALHPRQLAAIHDAFSPTADEVAWAERVVAAVANGAGTAVVDGEFVDAPVVRRAQEILALTAGGGA